MDAERFARLHGQACRILGGLQRACEFPDSDADDMRQEMALALLRLDGHADSFCLAAAMWAAVDWLRKTYGRRELSPVVQVADATPLVDSGRWRAVWC